MSFDCFRSARYLCLLRFALIKAWIQDHVYINEHYKIDGEQKKIIPPFFTFLVIARSFKEAAVCSLISNTVSLVFKNQNKSLSSMYIKITSGLKLFTLEMWFLNEPVYGSLDFGQLHPWIFLLPVWELSLKVLNCKGTKEKWKIPAWYLTVEIVIFLKS